MTDDSTGRSEIARNKKVAKILRPYNSNATLATWRYNKDCMQQEAAARPIVLSPAPRLAFTSSVTQTAIRMAVREMVSYDCSLACTAIRNEQASIEFQSMPPQAKKILVPPQQVNAFRADYFSSHSNSGYSTPEAPEVTESENFQSCFQEGITMTESSVRNAHRRKPSTAMNSKKIKPESFLENFSVQNDGITFQPNQLMIGSRVASEDKDQNHRRQQSDDSLPSTVKMYARGATPENKLSFGLEEPKTPVLGTEDLMGTSPSMAHYSNGTPRCHLNTQLTKIMSNMERRKNTRLPIIAEKSNETHLTTDLQLSHQPASLIEG